MPEACPYVSRAGLKLRHALDTFAIEPRALTCADLGCSTGGFTDCLLRAGASHVYSVDTAYGQLAWTLRKDPRVTVLERTNALHAPVPEGGVDLVVVDLGWTPQRLAVPAALRWLRTGGRIISLIKPHYEAKAADRGTLPRGGVLTDEQSTLVLDRVVAQFPSLGVRLMGIDRSPLRGTAGSPSHKEGRGNTEWLALLEPAD